MTAPYRLSFAVALAGLITTGFAQAQGVDPRTCPSGWASATARVDIPQTGRSNRNYQRRTLAVDIPNSATVLGINPSLRHPKFCWKEASSPYWRCHHNDPWQGEWFRFDSFRPDQVSPYGPTYKRYSVVAQNESHNLLRNAQLIVCYQSNATASPSDIRVRPGVVGRVR